MSRHIRLALFSLIGLPRAIWYIMTHPRIMLYILIILILNLVTFGLVVFVFFGLINDLISEIAIQSEVVVLLVQIFIGTLSLVFAILIFNSVSIAVSSPLYSAIAERVANDKGIPVPPRLSYQSLRDFWYSIEFELKKLFLSLIILILTLPLNLIPAIGQVIYGIINPLQIIIFNGLDLFEPAAARKQLSFRSKLWRIIKIPTYWPYLFMAGTLTSIPFLNVVTIPVAVVGGILVYNDHEKYAGTSN